MGVLSKDSWTGSVGAPVAPRKLALGRRNVYFKHILGWERIKNVFEFSGFSKYDFCISQIPGWSVFLAAAVLLATQYKLKKQTIKLIEQQQKYRNNTTK